MATLEGAALGHTLTLLVRFYGKVRFLVLTTGGAAVACVYDQMYDCARREEYVRIVSGGVL